MRAIPRRQDKPIFPARLANQNTGSASSCPRRCERCNKFWYQLLTTNVLFRLFGSLTPPQHFPYFWSIMTAFLARFTDFLISSFVDQYYHHRSYHYHRCCYYRYYYHYFCHCYQFPHMWQRRLKHFCVILADFIFRVEERSSEEGAVGKWKERRWRERQTRYK